MKMAHEERIVLRKIKIENEEEFTRSAGFICPKCQSHFLMSNLFEDHIREHHLDSKTVLEHHDEDLQISDKFYEENLNENETQSGTFSVKLFIENDKEINARDRCTYSKLFANQSNSEKTCAKACAQKPCLMSYTGEESYKCVACFRSCVLKGNHRIHERTHTSVKQHKCKVCSRSFNYKSCLTKHERIHTGEKPYKCEMCPRSFAQKSSLNKHIKTHTGEKSFKCKTCYKFYVSKGTLKIHERMFHTGKKPYRYRMCSQSFAYKSSLMQHQWNHTGKKPYKCEVCPRYFTDKSILSKHARIHTGKKPY